MDSEKSKTTLNAALSNPRQDIAELDALEKKIFALRYSAEELSSFGPCLDPAKATEERGEALAILGEQMQALLVDPQVGALLDRLHENRAVLDETHRAQVKILRRDRAQLVDVPPEVQSNFVRLATEANDVWKKQRMLMIGTSLLPISTNLLQVKLILHGIVMLKKTRTTYSSMILNTEATGPFMIHSLPRLRTP